MEKNQIDKYIDEKIKKHFFEIKAQFSDIEQEIDLYKDMAEKRMLKIKNSIHDKNNSNIEYSDDIKQLIKDDMDDRNKKLLNEINLILPNLISSRSSNLSYVWIAIIVLFAMQIMFLILK